MREHCIAEQEGEFVEFGCAVVLTFAGDPLSRQIEEAVRIDREASSGSVVMNIKREWIRPASIEIRAEKS